MRELSISEIEIISGGDSIDNFCAGFGIVASVYGLGALANWWNPVGQSALVAGGIIGVGCAAYALV